jgi:hypothetical protein
LDYSHDVKLMVDLMTAGRVSIFPVDARGLVTPPGFAASVSGQVGHIGTAPNAFGNAEMASQMKLGSEHADMENLATGTGGHAFFNNNDLRGAVLRVQSIGENYYTLAYSPKDKRYDGRFRRVEIKVSDPEAKLEYRRGYFADDPTRMAGHSPDPNSNALRAAMQRGAPNAAELPFQIQVKIATEQPDPNKPSDRLGDNPAALSGRPVVRYVFNWTIDLHDVHFTSLANGMHHGEVDATLAAYDADGKLLNSIFGVAPLDVNDLEYTEFLKSGFPLQQIFDIPAGLVFLRAGLLDPSNGHVGATEFPLMVQSVKARVAESAPHN